MARGDCFFRGAASTETAVRAGGSRVRLPRPARTWSFSRRLLKAASRGSGGGLDSASLWRGEGAWGVGAEGRGELGRGAPGSAGRGGVGFQSAGDSGRGLGAGSLPAEAAAQRRLCFLQEGRAAQRPFASAGLPRLSTFGAPQNPRDGAKVGPKSRGLGPSGRSLPPHLLSLGHFLQEERAVPAPSVAALGLRASLRCHPDPRRHR